MARHPWLVTALILILVAPAASQEYTLKLKQAAIGDTVLVKRTDQLKLELTLTDAAGNAVQSRKEAKGLALAVRETGMEKEQGPTRFTSLKPEYQKAERTDNPDQEQQP